MDQAKLVRIEPTPFLARDGLRRLVRVTLQCEGKAAPGALTMMGGGQEQRFDLGEVGAAESSRELYVRDLDAAGPAAWQLQVGSAADRLEMAWEPARRWELHLVHGSHHDLGYTDIPSNVLREHDRYLADVLDFCEQTAEWPEDSRFSYVVEQAWSICHFLEHAPVEMVERAVRLMREGRIEVTALLGNQTSELCGHEEQIRLLYPAFRLKRRYGVPIRTAELNDIPGVSWGLVSVLAGAGVRYFAPAMPDYFAWGPTTYRFEWDERAVLPRDMMGAFWWEGPDGSRVLFWYGGPRIAYPALWTLEQAERDLSAHLEHLTQGGYSHDLVRIKFIGGMRDNSPEDLRLSLIARAWNERWAYPHLIVSTNARFFTALEDRAGADLRVLRGDLPGTDYPVGALSTAEATGVNRRGHDTLTSAEKWATCAALTGDYVYPAEALAEASDCQLLYDEHTWGMTQPAGPAQAAHRAQKAELAYRGAALAHDVLAKSTNRLADFVALPDQGHHLVVFNPLGQRRSDVVRVPFAPVEPCGHPMYWRYDAEDGIPRLGNATAIGRRVVSLPLELLDEPFRLLDAATHEEIPYQIVTLADPTAPQPDASRRWALGNVYEASAAALNHGRGLLSELVFVAKEVPALGYRAYRIVRGESPQPAASSLQAGEYSLENAYYRVTLDPATGAIASIRDKELEREWIDQEAAAKANQLLVRTPTTGAITTPSSCRISPGEMGEVLASLVVHIGLPGCPQVVQEITLYERIKRIELANRVLRDATPFLEVYFAFPFAVPDPTFHYESSNSIISPIRDQLPGTNTSCYAMQHWASVSDQAAGIVWSSLDAPVVELGGLWPSPVSQAHHAITPPGYGDPFLSDPAQLEKGHIYSYAMANNFRTNFDPVQVADLCFHYALTTHAGDWRVARAWDFGWAASTPLEGVCVMGPQEGRLAPSGSFWCVDAPNVLVLAAKMAEDGDGVIVRLAETAGTATEVMLEVNAMDVAQAWLTNLAEENVGTLECARHSVRVPLRAYGLATVRCRPARDARVSESLWPVEPI